MILIDIYVIWFEVQGLIINNIIIVDQSLSDAAVYFSSKIRKFQVTISVLRDHKAHGVICNSESYIHTK